MKSELEQSVDYFLSSSLIMIREEADKMMDRWFLNLNKIQDESKTRCSYPTDLPNIDVQIERQMANIPGLSKVNVIKVENKKVFQFRSDGLMAVPFLSDLGHLLGIGDPYGLGYGLLGEKVLEGIVLQRPFFNYCQDKLGSAYCRLENKVRQNLQMLEIQSPLKEGKLRFHILPVNLGKSLYGASSRQACSQAFLLGCLPLGFVQIGCLLLGWPERLSTFSQMYLDCSADEYSLGTNDEHWSSCLFFHINEDKLKLGSHGALSVYPSCGSPCLFLREIGREIGA